MQKIHEDLKQEKSDKEIFSSQACNFRQLKKLIIIYNKLLKKGN